MSSLTKNKQPSENKETSYSQTIEDEPWQSSLQIEQNKLKKNKQKLQELRERADYLRAEKSNKIMKLDALNREIKQNKQQKQLLPLIKQLREHYKKIKLDMLESGAQGAISDFEDDDVDVDEMSYEQLLELGDKIGKVSKGISQQQFRELEVEQCMFNQQCSICQEDLIIGAECIKLKCGHTFDIECLKGWLKMEKICPLCKIEIL